jgi:hypothetical protein
MEIGDIVDVNSVQELELGVYEDLDTGLIIAVKGDGAYRPTRDGLVLVDHGSLGNSFMRIK